ncbi:hypothetical protein BCR43DRAFT_482177 [Syncephalastrum racemosum]|uniref:Uncharacterized protein n=1 Tax=Syncephalastrum racemosum TaxID=13706 RepID=A0A1X2HT68_SYNRA|nr:hypothetical protein BCR43DRAFT_482177 [Syncephalastrum racemosum]
MPQHPPPTPNDPQSELELIEQSFNNMVNGAFSLFFRQVFEPVVDEVSRDMPQSTIEANGAFDGSDFRRLAHKSKQRQRQPEDSDSNKYHEPDTRGARKTPDELVSGGAWDERSPAPLPALGRSPMMDLFQLLVSEPDVVPAQERRVMQEQYPETQNTWMFSSSSQRTSVQADGTEETVSTTTRNGVTETIRRVRYPDGSTEEFQEQRPVNTQGPFGFLTSSTSVPASGPLQDTEYPRRPSGMLSRLWGRWFGQ